MMGLRLRFSAFGVVVSVNSVRSVLRQTQTPNRSSSSRPPVTSTAGRVREAIFPRTAEAEKGRKGSVMANSIMSSVKGKVTAGGKGREGKGWGDGGECLSINKEVEYESQCGRRESSREWRRWKRT